MELLKNKILEHGHVLSDKILKVDSFLNHQIDAKLMREMGVEFASRFKDQNITKVLTVEASGIAPAYATALELGVDLVFARKNQSLTLNKESSEIVYTEIFSYTKNVTTGIYISKKYITKDDNVLIIDDFLANGEVCKGLIKLLEDLGANLCGIGIVIEKSFQSGRKAIEEKGIKIESLARISSLENSRVTFLE